MILFTDSTLNSSMTSNSGGIIYIFNLSFILDADSGTMVILGSTGSNSDGINAGSAMSTGMSFIMSMIDAGVL